MSESYDKNDKNHQRNLDALLRATARSESERAGFPALLEAIYARVREKGDAKKPTRRAPRLRFALIPAAALLAALIAVPALAQTVVVDGETYVAFNNRVKVDGVTHRLDAEEAPTLLQLANTNQYTALKVSPGGDEGPRIVVFLYGTKFGSDRNPNAVSGKKGEAVSIKPVEVYPLVGDLFVRRGPGTSYEGIAVLASGQCVTKVGIQGDWAILEYEGALAYAYDAYLFEAPARQEQYAPVALYATEPVNVRALPASRAESAVLYELSAGEKVSCTGVIGNWCEIAWQGKKAYVFGKYLTDSAVEGWYNDPAVGLLGKKNIDKIEVIELDGIGDPVYFDFSPAGAIDLKGYYAPPADMRVKVTARRIVTVRLKGGLSCFGMHVFVYDTDAQAKAQLREIAGRKLSPWIPDGPYHLRYRDGNRIVDFIGSGFPEFTAAQKKYEKEMLEKLKAAYGDYLTY